MIIGTNVFHVVRVAYELDFDADGKCENVKKTRVMVWDFLNAQAQGYWFENDLDEDWTKPIQSRFPDQLIRANHHYDNDLATVSYCFADYSDAELLINFLKIIEGSSK